MGCTTQGKTFLKVDFIEKVLKEAGVNFTMPEGTWWIKPLWALDA